jgi:hypothetical protein
LLLDINDNELRRKLFDIIIDVCEKIKFLHLGHVDIVNIPQLSKIIANANNYLNYLTLEIKSNNEVRDNYFYHSYYDYYNKDGLKISSMILKDLIKLLPHSLYYLDLLLMINPDDLQIAFENCKQIELKKLLIRNRRKSNEGTTLKVIKDFAKEKNLEFLSYNIGSSLSRVGENERHKSLEKLVEEVQSFTKVRRYNDLVIKVSEMDGTLINT